MAECRENECNSSREGAESEYSSRTSSVLCLSYSSSPFESQNSTSDTDEDSHRVKPYLYEPEQCSSDDAGELSVDDARTEKLDNTEWCQCGNCVVMPILTECVCYQEISATADNTGTSVPSNASLTMRELMLCVSMCRSSCLSTTLWYK